MRKRWIRLIFILTPILLLLVQIFWRSSSIRLDKNQPQIQALVPPLGIMFHYINFNEKSALSRWEEKLFHGRVAYWIDFDRTSGFVHAKSIQSTSAIFYRIRFKISDYPYVSWKWRVVKFPDKSNIEDPKKRDDFAARFYVVLVSRFFTNFKCVEYVWDESLPEETVLTSPYSKAIKQIVIQTGTDQLGKWVGETRNVFEDYQKLFGERPKMKVAAIALMTSSGGTQTEAEAFFDDIRIGAGK
ncbi:MAG: DUF3047 domain-containing protein [Candidatus Omnitrophica bacterium]|nr:DUF3047 domain-containing protein [Candidatus Omnitrophota bacterium]